MASAFAIEDNLERALALLDRHADVIEGRVTDGEPPGWLTTRGWTAFLRQLTVSEVERAERCGLAEVVVAQRSAPDSLVALVREARRLTQLPTLTRHPEPSVAGERRVPARKREQVDAVAALCAMGSQGARRVVDVGAGHGHLTRRLRARLGLDAIGLERDPARVATARQLAGADGPRFERRDLSAVSAQLRPADLVVGLHACGELGDQTLREAASVGAHLLLVPCCPQKIAGDRRPPLSRVGDHPALHLCRARLGLANLPQESSASSSSVAGAMRGREARLGLRLFLARRGVELEPGAEARGLSRHRFRQGLVTVTALACERRGWPAPTAAELAAVEREAAAAFAHLRRWTLPRNLLGRLLETAILLDRARFLEEQGYAVRVGRVFAAASSPRNLAILGRAP